MSEECDRIAVSTSESDSEGSVASMDKLEGVLAETVDSKGSSPSAVEGEASTSGGATAAVSSIERLLQQQRNEIMFELRRLQLGERPVTGQGHKEAVESFFTRSISGQPDGTPSDAHRPEHVTVEVEALVERRPVSSLLQSARFRRSLESALRTAIGSVGPGTPAPRVSSTNNANAATPRVTPDAVRNDNIPPPPPPPSVLSGPLSPPSLPPPSTWDESVPTVSTNVAIPAPRERSNPPPSPSARQQALDTPVLVGRNAVTAAVTGTNPRPASVVRDGTPPNHPLHWLQQHLPSVEQSDMRILGAWERLEDGRHEEFIHEISDLVQRQLVTSSLEGQFRNVLESRLQHRLAASDTNGRHVQQFIQNINQSTHHQRNDFSDLGILGPAEQLALSDEVSVISATAAVAVRDVQNHQLNREMSSMRSQMQELKNMMRMSFDMQLETQRMIRQEVAAAIAQAMGTTTSPPMPANNPVDDAHCLICLERTADSVLYQCGHLCVCHGCGIELKQRGHHCPVCRAPIRDIIRAYKSGQRQQ